MSDYVPTPQDDTPSIYCLQVGTQYIVSLMEFDDRQTATLAMVQINQHSACGATPIGWYPTEPEIRAALAKFDAFQDLNTRIVSEREVMLQAKQTGKGH